MTTSPSSTEPVTPSPPSVADVGLRIGLTVALAVALIALVFAAWTSIHPVAGALVAVVGFGTWWAVVTNREHERRLSIERAQALDRSRRPMSPPRPVPPPASGPAGDPFGGA